MKSTEHLIISVVSESQVIYTQYDGASLTNRVHTIITRKGRALWASKGKGIWYLAVTHLKLKSCSNAK